MKKNLLLICLAASLLLAGCGSSNNFNDISGQQGGGNVIVPAAPVARDDAYATDSNAQLAVSAANGVLTNDSQVGSVITYPAATAQNGGLAGNQDGSFTYTPPANFAGTDSFVYTLTNDFGSSSATVTITVNAVVAVDGFFVDATNGNDSTGSFDNGRPFQTIQAAVTAAGQGATIVVRPGNYTGTVNLLNNQRLVGAGSALVNPQGTVRPTLTGPVVLADGNTVDFLRIANAPGIAIDADNQVGGTVTNCEIDTNGGNQPGFSAFPTGGGDWQISNNRFDNVDGSAILFTIDGTNSAVVRINNNQISNSRLNAIGFITGNLSNLRAQVRGNTMTGNQTGFTFEVIAAEDSISCFDIEENTNDDTYRISANDAGPTLEVEEFDSLIAVNNNSGVVFTLNTLPTPVADGSCGF